MSWYSEYRNEWKEIIEAVARECKRAELMVEKDTVQSMFLLELSKINLPFVFKGGTSLSKAYNLIDRFSEDIDLSMNRKPTQTERKASKEHIVEIAKSLGMELTNPDQIKSRYDYNMYVFSYDSLFSEKPMEIIVETATIRQYTLLKNMKLEVLWENSVKIMGYHFQFRLKQRQLL